MIHAKQALLGTGWATEVRLTLDETRIADITTNAAAQAGDVRVDTLLPAPGNLHSHAFQRAMAGRTQTRRAGRDSFWSWRKLMYRFMDHLTPDQIQAIAALAYMEMQEAGFAAVGEFHYVHHQRGGMPYADPAELSARIFAAAETTQIGLTHLPVLYTYGGAGQAPLSAGQQRFGNDVDSFLTLHQAALNALRPLPQDTRIGIAPHSLRATSPDGLRALLDAHPGGPTHIHVAEQPREVAEIRAWLGARPVKWLLANADVGPDWCLVHATQMSAHETRELAQSGAVAGLCPITEADLGDGAFNGPAYLAAGGVYGIGSDSNLRISLIEELRMLEFSQRLRDGARNLMIAGSGSVGQSLLLGAARGGAQALGRKSGSIAKGYLADLLAIDSSHAALCALTPDQIADGLVFAAGDGVVTDLWSGGRHAVRQSRHVARDQILTAYRRAISTLMASI